MEKIEKQLNIFLGVVIAVLAVAVIFMAGQLISGKDASLFGFRVYHILTGSMEPTIKTGSEILVKSVDTDSLKVGDIISFVSRDQSIYGNINTHRIIDIGNDNGQKYFVTKGDANNSADTIHVVPSDVKGKVIFHVNIMGASTFLGFVKTIPGFISVILLPLLLICWRFTRIFKNEVDEMIRINNEMIEAQEKAAQEAAEPSVSYAHKEETDKEE